MSYRKTGAGIFSVTFADGVEAYTRSVHVSQTHAGLLEGRPSPESIERHLARLPSLVESWEGRWPVVIIPCEQERIEHPPTAHMPFTITEAWLPQFELVARFQTHVSKEPIMHGSCLALVWHQHEAFPFMHASVMQAVAGLRWWDHAEDFEY